jgi:hypothetical protein
VGVEDDGHGEEEMEVVVGGQEVQKVIRHGARALNRAGENVVSCDCPRLWVASFSLSNYSGRFFSA